MSYYFIFVYIHYQSVCFHSIAPAFGSSCLPKHAYILWHFIHHGHTIQMAEIATFKRHDKRRHPAWLKTISIINSYQARKQGIYSPQPAFFVPIHIVYINTTSIIAVSYTHLTLPTKR